MLTKITNDDLKSSFLQNQFVDMLFPEVENLYTKLYDMWTLPYRFFHTIENHLKPMLREIWSCSSSGKNIRDLLEIAAWFHDAIYDPKLGFNERRSANFFLQESDSLHEELKKKIEDLIICTMDHKPITNSEEEEWFINIDLHSLRETSPYKIVCNEQLLLKEFQFVDYSIYKEKRIQILETLESSEYVNEDTVSNIIQYLRNHRPKIAIYPGSFNPFHLGHLSILQEAEKLFDKVIVAIGRNPEKPNPPFDIIKQLKQTLPYHQTESFPGFLHEFVIEKSKDADITAVRGFRSGYDIDSELINLAFMQDMYPELKVIFIAPQKKFTHLSSSAIRQIRSFNPDNNIYVPNKYYPTGM